MNAVWKKSSKSWWTPYFQWVIFSEYQSRCVRKSGGRCRQSGFHPSMYSGVHAPVGVASDAVLSDMVVDALRNSSCEGVSDISRLCVINRFILNDEEVLMRRRFLFGFPEYREPLVEPSSSSGMVGSRVSELASSSYSLDDVGLPLWPVSKSLEFCDAASG